MKESGINYYYPKAGLDTGSFAVFYTFEDGAGVKVSSVSGGQTPYSGTLSSVGNFWSIPGTGNLTGQTITVNNASGLDSVVWTKVFVYEKVNTDILPLFDSTQNGSGWKIGVTPTNKVYFESFNGEPVVAASKNNLSSKNVISLSYAPNLITFGYLNLNSRTVETESYPYPFNLSRSDTWTLGGGTGYLDYFLYIKEYLSADTQNQLLSGVYARMTGIGYPVQSVCTTGITGYQSVFVGQTGITGQLITPGGDEGRDFYTGAFPTFHSVTYLTGYLSSGLYMSGVVGESCVSVTGDATDLIETLTGYASSFGMQKIQSFWYPDSQDIFKISVDRTTFRDIYNKNTTRSYSGYLLGSDYQSGDLNLFWNGVAQSASGWSVSGGYLTLPGTLNEDVLTLDLLSGFRSGQIVSGGILSYPWSYTGQELFFNGVNLISGHDFVKVASDIILTGANTGIDGYLFDNPIYLPYQTGRITVSGLASFQRDTSNIYLNGIRRWNKYEYVEGATYDLLSGNSFNYSGVVNVYNNTNLYWT